MWPTKVTALNQEVQTPGALARCVPWLPHPAWLWRAGGQRGSLRLEGNGVRLSQCRQVAESQDGQPVPPAGPGDPKGPAWPGSSLLEPGQKRLASCMLGSCVPWGAALWPDHVRDRACRQVQCSPGRSLGNNAALATWMGPEPASGTINCWLFSQGLGPRAQLSRTWLALGGSSPAQPQLPGQSQTSAFPLSPYCHPGCHLEYGWLLTAHRGSI